jgi:Mg-chelatase subunit ChlD
MQARFVATLVLAVVLALSAAVVGRLNSTHDVTAVASSSTSPGARPATSLPSAGSEPPPAASVDRIDESTGLRIQASTDRSVYFSGAAGGGLELRLTPVANLPRVPVDLVLVVDTSGSMSGDAIQHARAASLELVSGLRPGDTVSLVSYSDQAVRRVDRVDAVTEAALIRERIGALSANGGTCISCALQEVRRMEVPAESRRARRVVLLSDGMPTVGNISTQHLSDQARYLTYSGMVISSVGVGRDYNAELMQSFADSGRGNYFYVAHAEGLGEVLGRERAAMADIVRLEQVVEIQLPSSVSLVQGLALPGLQMNGYQLRWTTAHMPREGVNIAIPFDLAPSAVGLAEIGLRPQSGEQLVVSFGRTDSLSASNETVRLELTERLEVLRAANEVQLAMNDNLEGRTGMAQERIQNARSRLSGYQGALGGSFGAEADRLEEAGRFIASPAAASSGVRRSLQMQNAARSRELTGARSNEVDDEYHNEILVY